MSFDSASVKAERWVGRWHDIALLLVYVVFHLPSVLLVQSIQAIQYPLEAIYISRSMFDGLGLSRELATAAAIPANVGIFYGPLNYLFSLWLGTVQHLFWFGFVVQAFVPILAYRLLSTVTSKLNAFLVAVLLVAVSIRVQWWSPDFLAQPLLLALLYFWSKGGNQVGALRIVALGLLTAAIGMLKYHEGLILMTAIGGGLMFRLAVSDGPRRISNFVDILIVTLCFSTVVVIFAKNFLHIDEWLYYTLPGIVLIVSIYYLLSKHNASVLTNPATVGALFLYTAAALSLPVLSFAMFGSQFGYSKYFYATFKMGLEFLPVWDFGIIGLIRDHIGIRSGIARLAAVSMLIAIPLMVNIFIVSKLARVVSNSAFSFVAKREAMAVGSISVLGIYMLYPMESYHILVSKLGLFIFALLYFMGKIPSVTKWLPVVLIVLLIPISGLQMSKWWELRELNNNDLTPSVEVKSVVGIALAKPLSSELARQIEIINANVSSGCSYYVVDSSGGSLIGLAAIAPNGIKQVYIDLRPGLLNTTAIDLVNNQLESVDFALLRKKDMDNYVVEAARGTKIEPVLAKLHDEFTVTATYIRQGNEKGKEGFEDFVILRRITPRLVCSAGSVNIDTAKPPEKQR